MCKILPNESGSVHGIHLSWPYYGDAKIRELRHWIIESFENDVALDL